MRIDLKTARLAYRILCGLILLIAALQVFLSPARAADEPPTAAPAQGQAQAQAPAQTQPQQAAAFELEAKRVALEAKERELQDTEGRLKDREKDLDKKLAEMERLRQAVSGELEAQRKNNEERIGRMVAVFETMAPKSAAAVIETLDDWLSVEILKRMDVKRTAKVMNVMDKTRSAKLSELVTGFYRPEADRKVSSVKTQAASQGGTPTAPSQPASAPGQAPAKPNPQKKGGEK
jgi:flagellar motility protein MotE (MotC chaperone)